MIVNKANYGEEWHARFETTASPLFCAGREPWSTCWKAAELKINLDYPWWNQSGSPPGNQFDLYSAFVHEFGHGLSAPDLDGDDPSPYHADCGSGGSGSTMCNGFDLGESFRRTLETVDINAFNSRY